jgi:hypothetical protein
MRQPEVPRLDLYGRQPRRMGWLPEPAGRMPYPPRSLLPAFNFWTRAGMSGTGRRRMGVGFKIGLGGTYPSQRANP